MSDMKRFQARIWLAPKEFENDLSYRTAGSPTEVFSEIAPDAGAARERIVERVSKLYPDMFVAVLNLSELDD